MIRVTASAFISGELGRSGTSRAVLQHRSRAFGDQLRRGRIPVLLNVVSDRSARHPAPNERPETGRCINFFHQEPLAANRIRATAPATRCNCSVIRRESLFQLRVRHVP